MINSFKKLGERELKGLTAAEKKKKFLETQTIEPNEPRETNEDADKYREVIINLNTEINKIEIKSGEELTSENRADFFGFELLGRRSKKIYFTCNNLYYHLLTIPQMISYIKEKLDTNKYAEFLSFLNNLNSDFYNNEEKKSYLKLDKFSQKIKEQLTEYLGDDEISHNSIADALQEFVSKNVLGSTRKNFVKNLNIFSLKIDNKYITETKYAKDYIDIVYKERQGRFFDESENMVRKNAVCSICNDKTLITGKIDIPTKFYVTSSPYFFENLNDKNAYKSFGVCQNCYQDIMVGIGKVKNDFSNRLFNKLRYYAIPENLENVDYDKALVRLQNSLSGNYDKDLESIKVLNDMKTYNLKVNFLFWRPDQASFIVLDTINDVYYKDLQKKLREIYEVNTTLSHKKFSENYYFNFNDLYWLLFPNYKSHNSPDPKLYRKELLNLIDSIFKDREIDYHYLIKQFTFIFRKRYLKNKNNLRDMIKQPLKMNLLLKWLSQITNLKGGVKMAEGKSYIEIDDQDIREFFLTHEEVYQENNHRQGLFILGVLMNQILKEQKNKNINIMNKLSFDGLPVRRVKTFVKDITEMLNIYKVYQVNQLRHAQMIDRLQGIENSQLTKDEVVFYILSGISFGRYLGHKYYQKKEEEK